MTPAERTRLRATAALNRAPGSPQAALPRTAPPRDAALRNGPPRPGGSRTSIGPPALRRTTGIVLTAAGAILLLAVHGTVAFVATQRAGLVLLITGMLWLWLPIPDKQDRLRRRFNQLMRFLEWDPASAQEARCSLGDLLDEGSDSTPDGRRE